MSEVVYVRRQPNDYRTAAYRVSDVEDIHFGSVTGGIGLNLSHDALSGYVWCDGMIEGEIAHSCDHGPPPHRIKVVIPKACNDDRLWAKLAGREYREPKPLDMSPEAVASRHARAAKAARTRATKRADQVETLAIAVNAKWPEGRLPAAADISWRLGLDVPLAVARDARRRVMDLRKKNLGE